MRLSNFIQTGRATFLLGGQWGSEGKGAAAAWLAVLLAAAKQRDFAVVTTNAGAQAGHTSLHNGVKRVVFHLPTYPLIARQCGVRPVPLSYLNAGSIIDPDKLLQEIDEQCLSEESLRIHPNAAIITQDCRDAEGRADSAQTRIASTRKGVGEALSRKVLRSGMIARDCDKLKRFVSEIDLTYGMAGGDSVLVEVPQGIGLSFNGRFYPHCTSRDCTVAQGASDAGIHPSFVGPSVLVLRTHPIRVGNIPTDDQVKVSWSGPHYPDQQETNWEELNRPSEITTVTGRVRRVFSFSRLQMNEALRSARPTAVYLTFCDYIERRANLDALVRAIQDDAAKYGLQPDIVLQSGPSTSDAEVIT